VYFFVNQSKHPIIIEWEYEFENIQAAHSKFKLTWERKFKKIRNGISNEKCTFHFYVSYLRLLKHIWEIPHQKNVGYIANMCLFNNMSSGYCSTFWILVTLWPFVQGQEKIK